jgi:hypothetical protein
MINTLCVTYLFNFLIFFSNKTDVQTLDTETRVCLFFFGTEGVLWSFQKLSRYRSDIAPINSWLKLLKLNDVADMHIVYNRCVFMNFTVYYLSNM